MNKSFNELPGCFAYSLAGHDKGETYIIIECNDEYAFLANGKILQPFTFENVFVDLKIV